jgi:hypothetical protein
MWIIISLCQIVHIFFDNIVDDMFSEFFIMALKPLWKKILIPSGKISITKLYNIHLALSATSKDNVQFK